MKKHHWNGSLITATRQSPSSSAANGLFNLVSQQVFKSASKWPQYVTSGLNLYLDAGDSSSYVNYSTSGTTWSDVTANSNDGTLTNMAATAHTSSNGGYFTFDGTNDYVNGVNSSTTNITGSITVECLFRVSTSQTNWVRIFGKGDSTNRTYGLWYNTNTKQFLWQRYASGVFMSISYTVSSFALDTWHYLVGVSDGTTHTLYLNNQQVATTTNSTSTYYSSTDPYTVGYGTMGLKYHDGDISMIRLYNRALTSTERATNYNNEKGRWDGSIVTTGLIVHLDAGDLDSYSGSGTTWNDLTDNNNDGTLVNGTGYDGSNQGSLVFDGTNDYVDISGSTTVTAASFVVWVRLDGDQENYAGILYSRSTDVTGLSFYGTTEKISYTWNNASNTYDWDSGLTIPTQEWCMIAVTVTSSSATAYLYRSSGVSSSTNTVSHGSTTLDSLELGRDSQSTSRSYDGRVGVAQVYNRSLSSAELTANFNALKNRYGLS